MIAFAATTGPCASSPIRMSTADMLTDMGFEVCEARSAVEALALLNQDMKID